MLPGGRRAAAEFDGTRLNRPYGVLAWPPELDRGGAAMRETEVFELADRALSGVVARIEDHQWAGDVPKAMRWGDFHTLRELVGHHARDDSWVADTLAGRTLEEVGTAHDGDLLGVDPKGSFARIVEVAVGAVRGFDEPEKVVHLSYGDWPARTYLQHIIIFRGFGAVDMARVIGVDPELKPELVQGLWELVEPDAEALREWGVFGARVPVAEDAPLLERLLGLSGREPR